MKRGRSEGTLPTTWRWIAAGALSHGQLLCLETVHRALTMAVGHSEWKGQSNINLVYHYVFDLLSDSLGITYDRCSPPNPGTLPTTWRRIVEEALSHTQSLCLKTVQQALTTEVGHIEWEGTENIDLVRHAVGSLLLEVTQTHKHNKQTHTHTHTLSLSVYSHTVLGP